MPETLSRPARPGVDQIPTYDEVVPLVERGGRQYATPASPTARDALLRYHGFTEDPAGQPEAPSQGDQVPPPGEQVPTPAPDLCALLASAGLPVRVERVPPTCGAADDPVDDALDDGLWAAFDPTTACGSTGEVAEPDPEALADWVAGQNEDPLPPRARSPRRVPALADLPDLRGLAPAPARRLAVVLCVHGWGPDEVRATQGALAAVARLGASSSVVLVQNRASCGAATLAWQPPRATADRLHRRVVPNRGFAYACNAGLSVAQELGAQWTLFTQADCRWGADAVRYALGLARALGGRAVVGPSGGILLPGGGIREWGRNIGQVDQPPQAVHFCAGYWLLAPVREVAAVGGWDAGLFLYWEDVDFCLHLAAAGLPVVAWPALEVDHARGQTIRRRLFTRRVYEQIRAQSRERIGAAWDLGAV